MKIAQIDNNWGDFHPDRAFGIAAVLRNVTLGLIKNGHDVTVFAPQGSVFPGVHLVCVGQSLQAQGLHLFHEKSPRAQTAYIQEVVHYLRDFDVIHSHAEHVLLPFVKDLSAPVVSTIHGAGFFQREQAIFRNYPDGVYVALSNRAKQALPYIHFSYVVYNGIDIDKTTYHPTPQPPPYLSWLGRFAENKGALDAIAASKTSGDVLLMIGFEENGQEAYFQKVKEQEDGAMVRLLDKMIGDTTKYSFLGNAKAFLFPIHWEEPFGLVMVEAMACGVPVVAYNRGSVAEIVKDGVTGFIIDGDDEDRPGKGSWIIKKQGVEGLVEAIRRIGEIDRHACRKHVEENFTIEKMVDGYERVYKNVLWQGND